MGVNESKYTTAPHMIFNSYCYTSYHVVMFIDIAKFDAVEKPMPPLKTL